MNSFGHRQYSKYCWKDLTSVLMRVHHGLIILLLEGPMIITNAAYTADAADYNAPGSGATIDQRLCHRMADVSFHVSRIRTAWKDMKRTFSWIWWKKTSIDIIFIFCAKGRRTKKRFASFATPLSQSFHAMQPSPLWRHAQDFGVMRNPSLPPNGFPHSTFVVWEAYKKSYPAILTPAAFLKERSVSKFVLLILTCSWNQNICILFARLLLQLLFYLILTFCSTLICIFDPSTPDETSPGMGAGGQGAEMDEAHGSISWPCLLWLRLAVDWHFKL